LGENPGIGYTELMSEMGKRSFSSATEDQRALELSALKQRVGESVRELYDRFMSVLNYEVEPALGSHLRKVFKDGLHSELADRMVAAPSHTLVELKTIALMATNTSPTLPNRSPTKEPCLTTNSRTRWRNQRRRAYVRELRRVSAVEGVPLVPRVQTHPRGRHPLREMSRWQRGRVWHALDDLQKHVNKEITTIRGALE